MLPAAMVTCPACGKENDESAWECKRCRAPLREEEPPAPAGSLGEVCPRCEAFNEPGIRVCTNCGADLYARPAAGHPDRTPPDAFTPPSQVPETLSQELRALAISPEEAEEAGLTLPRDDSQFDKTPPDPFPAVSARAEGAFAAAFAPDPAPPGPTGRRPPPATPPAPREKHPPLPPDKPCTSCGALNPPAAKFCFDCGTPFPKKAAAAVQPPPSIQVDEALGAEYEDATTESAPIDVPPPAEAEAPGEPVEAEAPAGPAAEPVPQEEPPPFSARLVQEAGPGQGVAFALEHLENSIGGSAAHIGFGEDVYVAPHAATLAFVDERLVLRDEGSANGVYVKVREPAALEPGDLFVAGERLLRYDGPVEVPRGADADPPFLGAPRPQGPVVRVTEVLAGARTGRTCYRSGPSITIGRAGCDLNFPADALLAGKHAEIRIGEDGSAVLADVGEGSSGVFLRVRTQQPIELQAGDVLRIGQQQLRVEVG
ncbi:MAG: zinc ribbon domain-containing protein [Acidobacteriia bacterium]|nr:zinc ribbon domain-containing protein [Terriglobia bacterium]